MKLNRDAAITYAKRHWNCVCDDGLFYIESGPIKVNDKRYEFSAPAEAGWAFRFVPDGTGGEDAVFQHSLLPDKVVHRWDGLADCAHFLSRCLLAGDMPVDSYDVSELVEMLQERHDTRTLAERVTKKQGQNVIDSSVFKPGDVIAYSDIGEKHKYAHSAMYIGKIAVGLSGPLGRVTCHTVSRFGGLTRNISDEWHLPNNRYAYTFIHFSEDDA